MRLKCECKFIGKEYKESKKGNKYIVVTLIQNGSLLTVLSDVDVNVEFGQDVEAELFYNQRFKDLRLVSCA